MNSSQPPVTAAVVSAQFQDNFDTLKQFLIKTHSPDLEAISTALQDDLKSYQQDGILSVAFIGQYSAGKSTLISALTNRRDLKIDADIATDQTATYDWHGIRLIDTPGLYTDRTDHDELTYEAIAHSDLLVFCLTPMLFDAITASNFQHLAYKMAYRWKMMLVVNKMSDEAGDEETQVLSYKKSLQDALQPYVLDEFPLCFVDAKDYCDGVDEKDEDLLSMSRFDSFTEALNQFVDDRGTLSKLDTPIRICLKSLEDIEISLVRNSGKDTAFLEVLARLNRRLFKERERLRTQVKMINLDLVSAIIREGMNLAAEVGSKTFEASSQKAEMAVRQHYERAGDKLEQLVNQAIGTLKSEILNEIHSDLTQIFVARLEYDSNLDLDTVSPSTDARQLRDQVSWLQNIAEVLGGSLTKSASGKAATLSVVGQGFLSSSQVAGSVLHQAVLSLGHWVGFKFQPWQAVGIAKNIGNAATFLGPALALFAIGAEIFSMQQEQEQERQMAKIRNDVNSQFRSSAIDLENQIDKQLIEVEKEIYGKLERDIAIARLALEEEISTSNEDITTLLEIRAEFVKILDDVYHVLPEHMN